MSRTCIRAISVALLLPLAACATLFQGGPDQVTIRSRPPGAQVYLDDAPVGETPVTVTVRRNAEGQMRVVLEGYQERVLNLPTVSNGTVWLNFFSPYFVGFIVDAFTGSYTAWTDPPLVVFADTPVPPVEDIGQGFVVARTRKSPPLTTEPRKEWWEIEGARLAIVATVSQTAMQTEMIQLANGARVPLFSASTTPGDEIAESVASIVLQQSGYSLVDRGALDAVLAEQKLQMSDLTTPEKAAEFGRIVGANFIVYVRVTAAHGENRYFEGSAQPLVIPRFGVDVRVISAEDATLYYTARHDLRATDVLSEDLAVANVRQLYSIQSSIATFEELVRESIQEVLEPLRR